MGKMDLRIDQTGIYVRYNGNPNTPISDILLLNGPFCPAFFRYL